MNDFDIDVRPNSEFAVFRVECKVEAFSGYCLLFYLNRSFVKFALDIPSGIQGLEMPWRNRLENDAVALPSRHDVIQELSNIME